MDVLNIDYFQRLKDDYVKHGSLFVAFDFDNTVFDYHDAGVDYSKVIDLLKRCGVLGFKMILFTGNEDEKLSVILSYLKKHKIPFDYVNQNPIMKTRKPYYNILLDDRAGLIYSYNILNKLVNELQD